MVGQQHQGGADQLAARLVAAPGGGEPGMDRPFARLAGDGVGEGVQQPRRLRRQR